MKRTFNNIIKTILYLCFGLTGFIIFNFTIALILLNSSTSESANSPFLHKNYLGTINRAQRAYFLENSRFLDDLSNYKVLFGDEKYIKENSSSNYHYFIEVKDNIAFIYAIPPKKYDPKIFLGINLGEDEKKPFYSYVGATSINFEARPIVCKNKNVGILKPNPPILKEDSLICGEGTQENRGRG